MRPLPLFALALSVTALVSCKAVDAMDNTETMKSDLAAMKSTTGGMAGTTESMEATTRELKRKASIGEGLKLLDAPENNREYTPPQAGLLAGAKLVAENMNTDELIKFMYAKLKELNKTVPNEELYDRSLLGGYLPAYVAEFNRRKQVQLVALQAIAAQIPQDTIELLIKEQILGGGGRFSDTTYSVLMLRAMFINSFYLDAGVFSVKLDNLGKLRDAFRYTSELQFITQLPFADKIKLEVNSSALLPPVIPAVILPIDENYQESCVNVQGNPDCRPTLGEVPDLSAALNLRGAQTWWKKIVRKIGTLEKPAEMPVEFLQGDSPYAREIEEIRQTALRYAEQN